MCTAPRSATCASTPSAAQNGPLRSDQDDRVLPADRARRGRDGVDAGTGVERAGHVDPVVLREGLEDLGVLGQLLLGKARHHTTRVGQGHTELHLVADRERATDPLVLYEA